MEEFIFNIVFLIVGIWLGILFSSMRKYAGTLQIDETEDGKDKYLFIISVPIDTIPKRKDILMKVSRKKHPLV